MRGVDSLGRQRRGLSARCGQLWLAVMGLSARCGQPGPTEKDVDCKVWIAWANGERGSVQGVDSFG